LKLDQKKEIVEDLHERFSRAKIVIVTDYKGLDVQAVTELRRSLRDSEIEYQVVKNTLLVRAAEQTAVAVVKDHFKGPSAIALSFEDPVAPAKLLTEFAKKNEKLQIKAGVMDGRLLDLAAIKALSSLPPREVLLGQFLSVLVGVPTGLVRVLNGIPQKFMNVLQAIIEQKEQKEAA
jgi:large subunit ribosomal protein L10